MRILYRGNHQADLAPGVAPWSTESHLAASFELLGHDVVRNHEQTDDWATTLRQAEGADLFVWTSTWGYAERWPKGEAFGAIDYLNQRGVPTCALHLDRWWGLSREWQIAEQAMFRCRWVFTADGDHDHLWERANIRHFWMPPAVFGPECVDGTPREEFRSDVAFVGSWRWYEHPEHWPHREAMLDRIAERYRRGDRYRFWPRENEPAVRGQDLNDLYASVKVAVGDSCLAHVVRSYWSDRVPETIGRGAFLVHPAIPGLVEAIPEGMGVAYFPPGDFDAMVDVIDWWLAHDDQREEARQKGQRFIREHHTYERRMEQVLATLESEGAWR